MKYFKLNSIKELLKDASLLSLIDKAVIDRYTAHFKDNMFEALSIGIEELVDIRDTMDRGNIGQGNLNTHKDVFEDFKRIISLKVTSIEMFREIIELGTNMYRNEKPIAYDLQFCLAYYHMNANLLIDTIRIRGLEEIC